MARMGAVFRKIRVFRVICGPFFVNFVCFVVEQAVPLFFGTQHPPGQRTGLQPIHHPWLSVSIRGRLSRFNRPFGVQGAGPFSVFLSGNRLRIPTMAAATKAGTIRIRSMRMLQELGMPDS